MTAQRLDLLENNLNKKVALIKELAEVLDKQQELLNSSGVDLDLFDAYIDKQDALTESMEILNEEADELYQYLTKAQELSNAEYESAIGRIKELNAQLFADFDELQKKEQNVKNQIEMYFQKERKNFGDGRRSSKAALDYYKNMSGANVIPPQFMDQKK